MRASDALKGSERSTIGGRRADAARMMMHAYVYVLLSTLTLALYHKCLSMLFATMHVPVSCPAYEHVHDYVTRAYDGRQTELDSDSRAIIASNMATWIWHDRCLLGIMRCAGRGDNSPRDSSYLIWSLWRSSLDSFVASVMREKGSLGNLVEVRKPAGYTWQIQTRAARLITTISQPAPIRAMIEDARHFIESESRYAELGVPYRRGYLLHGPPGTGKSSCALCLAGVIKRPLCFLPLVSRRSTDDWLVEMLEEVPNGAVVLVDDYDRFVPSSENTGVTVAGLLNVLDGVIAQTGKIIILAANDTSRIPEAILRPGRIDRRFEFALTSPAEAGALYERFHGVRDQHCEDFIANIAGPRSAAAIMAHLVRYDGSPADTVAFASQIT